MTAYIAEARGVSVGVDCHSPPRHSAFKDPKELIAFIKELRLLTDGKPIGFKLCIGINTNVYINMLINMHYRT